MGVRNLVTRSESASWVTMRCPRRRMLYTFNPSGGSTSTHPRFEAAFNRFCLQMRCGI